MLLLWLIFGIQLTLAIVYPFPSRNHPVGLAVGGKSQSEHCDDGYYLIQSGKNGTAAQASHLCPHGYQLAALQDEMLMKKAINTLFLCKGPFSEAWVGSVTENNGNTMKGSISIVAPSAIEKSLAGIVPARINIQKSDMILPIICQRIN